MAKKLWRNRLIFNAFIACRAVSHLAPFRARDLMVLTTLLCACFLSPVSAQTTTLFFESFDESAGSTSGSSVEGISWSASGGPGTGGVNNGAYEWTPANQGGETTWQTAAIDLTGYTNFQISFDYAESNANGEAVVSMTNGTLNSGATSVTVGSGNVNSIVTYTLDFVSTGSSTTISIVLSNNANKTTSIDNVTLTGEAVVSGCTDSGACNYNASANSDDGSCTYASTWYADAMAMAWAIPELQPPAAPSRRAMWPTARTTAMIPRLATTMKRAIPAALLQRRIMTATEIV